jgi:hypothetical protein
MVSTSQMHHQISSASLALGPGYKYDEDSVLDFDSVLDMSPHMADSRRESFAVGPALFSPKAEAWDTVDMQSVPSTTGYSEHQNSNNPFFRIDQSQTSGPFANHAAHWAFTQSSGTCTPMPQYDVLPDFDTKTSIFQQPMTASAPFGNSSLNLFSSLDATPVMGSFIPAASASAGQNETEMDMPRNEVSAHAQKKLPTSPPVRSHNELRRGDGIRKKNARFEIPPDRNLSNIDQLISQSTDDQEVKELKQQKRLLRNRQAA